MSKSADDGTRRAASPLGRRAWIASSAGAIWVALLLGFAAGCGPGAAPSASVISPVTESEARSMTENMLVAFNTGDYAAWSGDWSEAMKSAIPEQSFQDFRQQTLAQAGMFQAIETITSRPGQQPGVIRWESTVQFEKGSYVFMIAFEEGSKQIEGVNLSPAP